MSGNTFGQLFAVTNFGESHGPAIGCVIDGYSSDGARTAVLGSPRREAQAMARLSHPNIVTAHDADEARGLHFLVMESR